MKHKILLLIVSTLLFLILDLGIILFAISGENRIWAVFFIPILVIGYILFLFFKFLLPYLRDKKNQNIDLTGNSNLGEFEIGRAHV